MAPAGRGVRLVSDRRREQRLRCPSSQWNHIAGALL